MAKIFHLLKNCLVLNVGNGGMILNTINHRIIIPFPSISPFPIRTKHAHWKKVPEKESRRLLKGHRAESLVSFHQALVP
jgi:hypothetical protein